MISEQDVLNALARIADPDGRGAPGESGAIGGVSIRNDKIYVSIVADPAHPEKAEPMRAAAEAALKSLPGVAGVLVTLTAERPQGQGAAATKPAARAEVRKGAIDMPDVRFIVAVASGKGGVGKSTTAANLALGLAATGWRVGILDADIYGPSLPRLFNIKDRPLGVGGMLQPMTAYGLKLMSIGFLVEEDVAMVWRGPMVMSALQQMLRDVNWGELDCLIVDMPPGTGDAQLTMAQSVALAGAVIVSTPQDLALIDARRGVAMFEKVEVPVLGVIENMSYFLCPHCGGRSDIFAHGGARHEAERMGEPFLGEVPLHMSIRENSDAGRPVVAVAPDSAEAKIYLDIARKVRARLEGGAGRAAPRIVVD
jgi:ATP-binding protein involved in chromosome partitioning